MKLLKLSEAARLLGVTRQAIDYLTRNGKLPVVIIPGAAGRGRTVAGGRRCVREADVLRLLRRRMED